MKQKNNFIFVYRIVNKKCQDSKTKFDRLEKNIKKGKVAQGSTHTRQTSDTNWTSIRLFKGDQDMSVIHL